MSPEALAGSFKAFKFFPPELQASLLCFGAFFAWPRIFMAHPNLDSNRQQPKTRIHPHIPKFTFGRAPQWLHTVTFHSNANFPDETRFMWPIASPVYANLGKTHSYMAKWEEILLRFEPGQAQIDFFWHS